MKDYMKIYQEWLSNPYFDEATKEELRAIEGNENEIKEPVTRPMYPASVTLAN